MHVHILNRYITQSTSCPTVHMHYLSPPIKLLGIGINILPIFVKKQKFRHHLIFLPANGLFYWQQRKERYRIIKSVTKVNFLFQRINHRIFPHNRYDEDTRLHTDLSIYRIMHDHPNSGNISKVCHGTQRRHGILEKEKITTSIELKGIVFLRMLTLLEFRITFDIEEDRIPSGCQCYYYLTMLPTRQILLHSHKGKAKQ